MTDDVIRGLERAIAIVAGEDATGTVSVPYLIEELRAEIEYVRIYGDD